MNEVLPWQLVGDARLLRGDGEHGEQTEGDARRHSLNVDPEGDPRQDDNEDAGDVELDEVVLEHAPQFERRLDTAEVSGGVDLAASGCRERTHGELGQLDAGVVDLDLCGSPAQLLLAALVADCSEPEHRAVLGVHACLSY